MSLDIFHVIIQTIHDSLTHLSINGEVNIKEDYEDRFNKKNSIKIKIHNWVGNWKLSIEGIVLKSSKNDKNVILGKDLKSYISADNEQDVFDLHTHMVWETPLCCYLCWFLS